MNLPIDDAQLLRQCQRGDENALAEIIRRYERRLFQVAFRVSGDRALAEEATVDSFYKIWRKAGQWRGQTSPEAWLYRIAVRTVLDLRRGRRRWWNRMRLGSQAGKESSSEEAADALVAQEQHEQLAIRLNQATKTLKEEDRLLVHLYYFEARSLADIATILDVTRDALKMRLARARKRLRRELGDYDHDSDT